MDVQARTVSLRLLAAMLTIVLLAVAGFWFWKAGRSERHVPEGAYLVQAGQVAVPAQSHTPAPLGGN